MGNYITYSDIETFLGVTFTTAQQARVNALIEQVETEIETRTARAWRLKTVTNELHSVDIVYRRWKGLPIYTKFRPIVSVTSVERYIGGETNVWETLSSSDYTIGSASQGIVYLRGVYLGIVDPVQEYRISYTYGEVGANNTPNPDGLVRLTCILLTSYYLITTESKYFIIPEGADKISLKERAEMWYKSVQENIWRLEEPQVAQI